MTNPYDPNNQDDSELRNPEATPLGSYSDLNAEPVQPAPAYDYNYQDAEPQKKNVLGLLTLIFGIIALVVGFLPGFGMILPVVVLVLAIVSFVQMRHYPAPAKRKGMTIIGLILGILGFVISVLIGLFVLGSLTEQCGDPNSPGFEECVNSLRQDSSNN